MCVCVSQRERERVESDHDSVDAPVFTHLLFSMRPRTNGDARNAGVCFTSCLTFILSRDEIVSRKQNPADEFTFHGFLEQGRAADLIWDGAKRRLFRQIQSEGGREGEREGRGRILEPQMNTLKSQMKTAGSCTASNYAWHIGMRIHTPEQIKPLA